MGQRHPPGITVFCDTHFPRLVRMLDLLLDDLGVAEELAQEALVRAAADWERVSRLDDPGGWLRHVARNLATSTWRRWQAARRAEARLGPADTVHTDADVATAVTVRAGLQQLSRRDREVLVLRHFVGLSAAQTAAELAVSVSVVTTRTSRAAARLRAVLQTPEDADA